MPETITIMFAKYFNNLSIFRAQKNKYIYEVSMEIKLSTNQASFIVLTSKK